MKQSLFRKRDRKLARDGPLHVTRSKSFSDKKRISSGTTAQTSTGRLQIASYDPLMLSMTVGDSATHMDVFGRRNDCSDASLSSPRTAKSVVLKRIGRLTKLSPVTFRVALRKRENAQSFLLSRSWLVPSIMLNLASGQLALCNVSFFVADDDLACKNLVVGLPVG